MTINSCPLQLLLVEDRLSDVDFIQQHARAAGEMDLTHAVRLSDAVRLLQHDNFDAILLDLSLPDSTGLATFHGVARWTQRAPIIIVSSLVNDQVALEAVTAGAQDYLAKGSITPELLRRTVKHAIARQKLRLRLAESERRLDFAIAQLPAIMWTTDRDMVFTSVRGRELATLKLEASQVVGQSVAEFFGSQDPDLPTLEIHRRALQGESVSRNVFFAGYWFHTHVEPLLDEQRNVIGAIGIALDVTGEEQLRRDVEAAHRIQQHLLPAKPPEVAGFDIAGHCYPAAWCSGDFFDFVPLPSGKLAIVLADVSGHGFGPSILAAAIRSYLRTAAVVGHRIHEMLALGNRLLLADGDDTPFATVLLLSLDPATRRFQFSAAGHRGYFLRRSGSVQTLENACIPIGVSREQAFPISRPARIHRGEMLIVISDGLYEARSPQGEPYGLERAWDVLRQVQDQPAREIVRRLYDAVCDFAHTRQHKDDITIVIAKALPAPSVSAADDSDQTPASQPSGVETDTAVSL